jgi:hypothetical protein
MTDNYLKSLELICGSGHLAKSCCDYFDYLLKLKSGEIIFYREAEIVSDKFIRLKQAKFINNIKIDVYGYESDLITERGIDVAISEIVWVIDAPLGS